MTRSITASFAAIRPARSANLMGGNGLLRSVHCNEWNPEPLAVAENTVLVFFNTSHVLLPSYLTKPSSRSAAVQSRLGLSVTHRKSSNGRPNSRLPMAAFATSSCPPGG
jgi:hypothetical protein